jgi:plasmid stabilization system protein ParE
VSLRVVFHALAERELNQAAQFYESECPGLGAAFLDDVQRCTSLILDHLSAGQVLSGNVRRRLVRRFPYAVLYRILPDTVRILAIMNLRRRPDYWTGRE